MLMGQQLAKSQWWGSEEDFFARLSKDLDIVRDGGEPAYPSRYNEIDGHTM